MPEVLLFAVAFAPPLVWAGLLLASKRYRTQPALVAYLSFTALSGVVLWVGHPAGWIASRLHYTFYYVGVEVITWALLAATLVELASLSAPNRRGFQAAAQTLVRGFLTVCMIGVLAVVFAPESWIDSTRAFHYAERSVIQVGLALSWAAFYLSSKYFHVKPTGRVAIEGWILAGLSFGYAALQLAGGDMSRIAICILTAAGCSYGASLSFKPGPEVSPQPTRALSDEVRADLRQALARLDHLDNSLNAMVKEVD